MPEGPEVVLLTQYINMNFAKKKITSMKIISGRYKHQKIKGFNINFPVRLNHVDSKGKFIWFDMTDNDGNKLYLMNTLGLTGHWFKDGDKDANIRFTISFSNNDLDFIDNRNFGTIEFTDSNEKLQKKLTKLAPDVLKSDMSDNDLVEIINKFIKKSRKDMNLVKILMSQESIVSGIGNYLVAEILYDCKLDPHRSLDDLSSSEIKSLAHSMRKIVKKAYYKNISGYMSSYENFMKDHDVMIDKDIFPDYHPDIKVKSKFEFKVYQQKTDPHGNNVSTDEIIKGRKIHWVKKIQK